VKYILHFFYLFIILFNSFSLHALDSNWGESEVSKVRLISPLSHNNNQNNIKMGLEYQLKPGWKTYWLSPGEGGFPQELNWNKSTNVKNIKVDWPTPKEFEILGIKSLGYYDKVIFPLTIELNDPSKNSLINLSVNYLVCKEICIPGKADLELIIPAGNAKPTSYFHAIEKALSSLPQKNIDLTNVSNFNINVFSDKKTTSFNLQIDTKSFFNNPKIYLHTPFGLPLVNPILDYSFDYKSVKAIFNFNNELITKKSFEISALLIDENHNFQYIKELEINKLDSLNFSNKLLFYIFTALIGGLILNIMPCVFPILSIKLLSVLQSKSKDTRISFLITALGIVTSFLFISVVFFILRQANISVAWGMQFQHPYFLIIITFILSCFMLNMFGLFEFKTPQFINSVFFIKNNQNKFTKDFFNGFFATVLATPCSAPFVGTAITAAFTESNVVMFAIFTSMGVGMSLPYLLITIFPSLVSLLPKPGVWMQYVKYFLGFLLFLTILWVINILLNHLNYYFIFTALIVFILTIFFLIKYKHSLLIILIGLVSFFVLLQFEFFNQNQLEKNYIGWQNFNEVQVNNLIKDNNLIFIDITADWCATCQFNKVNVLNNKKIIELLDNNNLVKIRGDWTIPNEKIEMFLNKNNRYGIPFNAFYSKNFPNGIILSELLSEKEIFEAINKLKN